MNKQNKNESNGKSPWLFFGLTYAMSWLTWGAVVISGAAGSPMLILAGALAPSVIGVALTMLNRDKEYRRDFWRRVVDFKRIGPGWYGVILLLFPILRGLPIALNSLLGGQPVNFDIALQTLGSPVLLLTLAFMMFFGGPLAEELGWRGYVLDRLQTRWSALVSALILGILWAFWHLPTFFIKGSAQATMGFGLEFWLFISDTVVMSVLFTWVYNNTQRSTLAAILLHWSNNFFITLVTGMGGALPLQVLIIMAVFDLILCTVVVVGWGAKTMTRESAGMVNNPVAGNLS